MPLILVQNETTVDAQYERWKDIEGEQYHFPNQYKNKLQEGELFIYYRGSRRTGKLRGTPEYFGFGRIGSKWIDPGSIGEGTKSKLQWYCEVRDYIPFLKPVPAKINDLYFEKIPSNLWSVGVRTISQEVFDSILAAAGIYETREDAITGNPEKIIADLKNVVPEMISPSQSLVVPAGEKVNSDEGDRLTYFSSPRYSKYAKLYGDRSEEIVYKVLTDRFEHRLSWVAREGKKPGWDIEYYEQDNEIAVEVKGTSGKRFRNLEITAGEWRAAENKRQLYNLYLVADCLSTKPLIQVINDPYDLYLQKKISLEPTGYRMLFNIRLD